ncbi:MAG TPA: reductive dehalogenase domain-containing protein [Alphaproteobacteria bacterium]|jgi:ferredoxin|nr:reductive dehalogenase domain-containing protein [Alphaproteobacteria bacterium]
MPKPIAFRPSKEQQDLFPDISGNTINGLGEQAPRRPTPVYWHSPKRIAHGALQAWMLKQTQKHVPEVMALDRTLGGRGPGERAARATQLVERSPEDWRATVEDFALAHEADMVGVTALRQDWVFEGYEADQPWIIVLAVAMDHGQLVTAPEPPSVIEVMHQYNRGTRASRALADWIMGQGYDAIPHGGPQAGPMLLIPPALECGFGELGKHGSLINRRYGSSFRLAGVLTDLPLTADNPDSFGADEFCRHCRLCREACPSNAIFGNKQ